MVDLVRKNANANGNGELTDEAQTIAGDKTFTGTAIQLGRAVSHLSEGFISSDVQTGALTGNGTYFFKSVASAGASASTINLAIVTAATGVASFYVRAVCASASTSSVYHGIAYHNGTVGSIHNAMTLVLGSAFTISIAWSGNTLQFTQTSTFTASAIEVMAVSRGNDIRIDFPAAVIP